MSVQLTAVRSVVVAAILPLVAPPFPATSPARQSCAIVEVVGADGQIARKEICRVETSQSNDSPPTPRPAPGGGAGGSRTCNWTEAIEGVNGEVMPGRLERSNTGGVIETLHYSSCDNAWGWFGAGDGTNEPPPPTPQDLLPSARARVVEMLPTPVLRINPADTHPLGYAFVQIETYFWIDQAVGQWSPVSATVSLRGLALTLTATPRRLELDTGDGGSVTCDGAQPPYPASMPDDFPEGCGYTYRNSSAMAPNGATFPVRGTVVWTTAWSASNGESGTLDTLTTASATRDLAVAEVQAINVPSPGG